MIPDPNDAWEDNIDSNADNQSDAENTLSLEEQEQINSANLAQRIEDENAPGDEYSDDNETIDQPSQAEESLSDFLERSIPESGNDLTVEDDKPLTRNLLGDNPPGSEKVAFESGYLGDASAEQFKYDEDNLVEGFRENLDKTEQQINLDKKLKDDPDD